MSSPLLSGFLCALLALGWAARAEADEAFDELTILVPAEPSGGWDLTAKAMVEALLAEGLAQKVLIEYSPGAGGLIGLAQFISSRAGQGNALFVGGMFTVGAVIQNHSAVSLLDATPLARLTFDNAAVAVPGDSRFRTADDLLETMISAPESISWVGGSRAGVDEINLHEIARALGVPAARVRYTGLPGGGEVGRALAEGRFRAGISGYSEFESLQEQGQLRVLAVLTADDLHGVRVPEFKSLGIPVAKLNWRGIFAPPGIATDQYQSLIAMTDRMVHSQAWQQQLERHHWLDAYLAGEDFARFVAAEGDEVAEELSSMTETAPDAGKAIQGVLWRRYAWAVGLSLVSVLLIGVLVIERRRAQQREEGLQQAYEAATGQAMLHTEALERALTDVQTHIESQFDRWNLTVAEKEIALLLLKGLRLKDIAEARGTSERTVRQQAQSVYRKAGLEGRFELAAYFIEDVIHSMEVDRKFDAPAV